MVLNIILLVISTIGAGLGYFLIRNPQQSSFKSVLVYAGAYLFSITIIHILPELFSESDKPYELGIWLLAGFFLQHILEYFTSGVEHGHIHSHNHSSSAYLVVIALCIHALLEGSLLSHPSSSHAQHESETILFGIILHKMPAAFALMAIMNDFFKSKMSSIIVLIVFALMSPIGLVLTNFITLDDKGIQYLFAIVGGSFLHISTTIFVESNPGHQRDFKKLIALFLGVLSAILVESL